MKKGDKVEIIWSMGEDPEIFIFDSIDRGFLLLIDKSGNKIPCRESTLYKLEIKNESD